MFTITAKLNRKPDFYNKKREQRDERGRNKKSRGTGMAAAAI
jgi:hypothetical protein